MTAVLLEGKPMAKRVGKPTKARGPLLKRNLFRLGHAEIVVPVQDLVKLVEAKTGESISRQRLHQMLNAVDVPDEVIATIAKALGVKPDELLRDEEVCF